MKHLHVWILFPVALLIYLNIVSCSDFLTSYGSHSETVDTSLSDDILVLGIEGLNNNFVIIIIIIIIL